MSAASTSSIGGNLAVLRKAAGLTSVSSPAARRSRPAYSPRSRSDRAAGHAVARALRTTPQVVHGQPYPDAPNGRCHRGLRAAVRRYDLPEHDGPGQPLPRLREDAARMSALRRDARCGQLALRLPALLAELTAAVHRPGPATIDDTRN